MDTSSNRIKPLYRGTQAVWYILGLLEVLLLFRFVLKFLAANPAAGFSRFIYTVTSPFTAPFSAVFRATRVEGSVFEWTTLLAMFVYLLVAYAVIRLLVMGKPVSTPEADVRLREQE